MGAWLIMAVNGVLLGGCCFLVANVVTQIGSEALEPSPIDPIPARIEQPTQELAAAPSVILERNLFGARLTGDTVVSDAPSNEPLKATKLPLRLLGTAAATEEDRSRAAIEDKKTKKHMVVAVGDTLQGHSRVSVTGIERTRVILDNAGRAEELALHEDDPKRRVNRASARRQAKRPRRAAAKPTLNDRLEQLSGNGGDNLSRILSSARIVPHYENGQMLGMKVDAIKTDSPFERLGLQNGDVITEVNGIVLDRASASREIFAEFAEAETIEAAIQRGEDSLTMSANPEQLMEQE